MIISKQFTNKIYLVSIVVSLSLSFWASSKSIKPPFFISKQQESLNINFSFWKYFHLGQKRLISSWLWVATILESDIEHYKEKDLNSWMFLRFKTISLLEPLFLETYNFGGTYLSIIKDDLSGASYIYKKGLQLYPDNYSLLKNAAFHFHFEVEDYKESFKILNSLKKYSYLNPSLLSALARIHSQNGNLEDSFKVLYEMYTNMNAKNNPLSVKIFEHLYAIRAELDLDCLNKNQINCNSIDLEGNKYNKNFLGHFEARKKWIPFRAKKRVRVEQ